MATTKNGITYEIKTELSKAQYDKYQKILSDSAGKIEVGENKKPIFKISLDVQSKLDDFLVRQMLISVKDNKESPYSEFQSINYQDALEIQEAIKITCGIEKINESDSLKKE